MTLAELCLKIKENSTLISLGVALLLTLIQITPLKLNPWSRILWCIRRIFVGDLNEKVDKLSEDINSLRQETKSLRQEAEEREAINARIRILRFSDDIISGRSVYSKEHYRQMFDEITRYNRYCNEHPNFKNELTVEACKNISRTYQKLINDGVFAEKEPKVVGWFYD